MHLNWERSANGLTGVGLDRTPVQTPNPVGVAYKKAWDVDWVRAAFGSEWTGFEPYVRVWIKEGKDAVGLTILMHNYPRDRDTDPLPDVCVRWADWRGQSAIQGFLA